jgi:predicted LPLAT superfamily acyltransferase
MSTPAEELPDTAAWTRMPERSNLMTLRLMTWISLRMGRPVGRLLLYPIAAYFVLFAPVSRRASYQYLSHALGRPAKWREVYRHFFFFASTILDRIYLINKRFDLFDIEIVGKEAIQRQLAEDKGLFLMGAHFGSFEALRAIGRQIPGLRVAMTMHQDNAQMINAVLNAINPEAGMDTIGLGHIDSMLKVHEALESGTIVGMLGDRTLGEDKMTRLDFLGTPADFPNGPFRMAALLKRPVMFMLGVYLGGNRYRIHFEPLADFRNIPTGKRAEVIQEAIRRYAELLNQHCRAEPYNWFNFFDFWASAETERQRENKHA